MRVLRKLNDPRFVPDSTIMTRDPARIAPDTPTDEAIETMMRHRVSCLPVIRDDRLVGIISERDLMAITRELLLRRIRRPVRATRRWKV